MLSAYAQQLFIIAGINIILANSLNLISGITGQLSLGHAGFMAIGAYVSAFISISYLNEPMYFPISLMFGGMAASIFGFILGVPTLRLRGDYLAIVTLGFSEMIRVLLLNLELTGGARGLPQIPAFTTIFWVIAAAVLTLFFISSLMSSKIGRAFLAIREDELAAKHSGIHTTKYKVIAFVMGAFMAGIAGGLFAHFLSYINPSIFSFTKSFEILTMVVLGGLGSLSGATFAAVILTFLPEALRPLQDYTHLDLRMLIYSILLVLLMLTRPTGLLGKKEIWELSLFRRRAA